MKTTLRDFIKMGVILFDKGNGRVDVRDFHEGYLIGTYNKKYIHKICREERYDVKKMYCHTLI